MIKLAVDAMGGDLGSSIVVQAVLNYLKTNKYVDTFRLGTFGEGEMGVTIVNLKI